MATIIDLTGAWAGTEVSLFGTVLEGVPGLQRAPVEVHALPRQVGALAPVMESVGAHLTTVPEGSASGSIAAGIAETIQRMPADATVIRVYSFVPAVRRVVSVLGAAHNFQLEFFSLAPLARSSGQRLRWDSSFMSEEDAALAVTSAIARRSSHVVYKTDLRQTLEITDDRFSKVSGSFASSQGFISSLVNLAASRGLIEVSGSEPRIKITLTDKGLRVATEQPIVRGAVERTNDERLAKVSRSTLFMDEWRGANLGPFMTVRTKVYDEIDRTISSGPKELKKLVNDAVRAVREAEPSDDMKFPWSRVRQFIESLMYRCPVAVSGGENIALDWSNGKRLVEAMRDDWQLRLDGVLVLHLIENGLDVTLHDLPELAGALYNSRDEDATDRAYDVVQQLQGDGLIDAGAPDDPLRLVPPAQPGELPDVTRPLRLAAGGEDPA
jgi:hypothetical protein